MEIVLYKPSDTKNPSNARAHAAKIGWQRSAKAAKLKERQRTLNGILPERLAKTTSHGRDSTLRHGTGYLSEDFDSSFAPVLARNVPPSRYGAASLPTIDNSKGIAGAEVAEFLGTFIWPNVGGLVAASQWFQDFCTVPTLYHAQTAASATYRDLMGGSNTWSGNSATFQHRLQAVRLIRATLETYSNLQSKEREQVIFAILILGSHEVKKKDFVEMKSPFFSYFPTASLLHLWARTDPIHAHDNAAFALIEGQGGLDALDSPGLAPMAALVDLLRACSQNLRPRLSCFWKHHVLDMTSSFTDHAGNPATSFPGIGFALLSPKLPASAISVFTEIACLDRVMSTSSSEAVAESELGFLLGVRNATLHRLCCLGPPDRQPVATDVGTTLYEAMKLAALIYCNGVLLAIPPQNRWLARLSTLLQDVLLSGHIRLSDEVCRNAYVWVVFVGGIVSCNAPEAAFFEVLLRNMLPHYGPGWQAMERILSTFIWTDMACKLEAHAFWRRCTLDMANR